MSESLIREAIDLGLLPAATTGTAKPVTPAPVVNGWTPAMAAAVIQRAS